ncbi:hypothetical protein V8E55_001118 [Tylopilus felleus]
MGEGLTNGLWKGALDAAHEFTVPRLATCQILCEGLESIDGIVDAVECFHGMAGEWTVKTVTQDENGEMATKITKLRSSALDLDLVMKLYDRLNDLPTPWFTASRMKLPCIAFKLPPLLPSRARSGRDFRVDTPVFGMVEIKTKQDLSRFKSVYLVHPWFDILLDREETSSGAFAEDEEAEDEEASLPDTDDEDGSDAEGEDVSDEGEVDLDEAPMDKETRALRLITRLSQPFGALLLSVTSRRRRAVVYKRIATDSQITVQLGGNVYL